MRGRAGMLRIVVALLVIVATRAPASEPAHRRFLVLYSAHAALAANVEATAGIVAAFDRAFGANYELYMEYRDDQRFPGPEEDRAFSETMARKYGGQRFDAILTAGGWALDYVAREQGSLGIEAPVVYGGVPEAEVARRSLPAGMHGVVTHYSVAATLALARRLQPTARRAVLMFGSGSVDRSWEALARRQLAGVGGIEIDYVTGLGLEGFREVAAGLDPDTILIPLTISEDADGQRFTPVNAAELIATQAAAPSYTVYDTFIGRGVVGGETQLFGDIGTAMAEEAVLLAKGEPVAERAEVATRTLIDWRAFTRFGLDRRLLPPDAELRFYDPGMWERSRAWILLAAAVILAQSGTIAALAIQERRRRAAQHELAIRRAELAHVSRVAQLGELSGALAHELNQPLTSILANAEAGGELIGRDPLDRDEIAAILADIAEDDRRAAAIIADLRRMMVKGEPELRVVDLNATVETAIRLTRSELLVRGVQVETRLGRGEMPVRANRSQLKQVLLNLMLNAAEAMAGQPEGRRRITVTTRVRADDWRELTLSDLGPGLPAEIAANPFRPFATTKATGLGLGLSICRTIVQGHRGTLQFDTTVAEGTRAVLALPPP